MPNVAIKIAVPNLAVRGDSTANPITSSIDLTPVVINWTNTPADSLPTGADLTASYSSTAGTISSVVVSYTNQHGPVASNYDIQPGDTISFSILVTDSVSNTNTFGGGQEIDQIPIPSNTVVPDASASNPYVGITASVTTGTWTPTPSEYGYRWLRDGVPISGATASSYTFVSADSGTVVSVQVRARIVDDETGDWSGWVAADETFSVVTPSVATLTGLAWGPQNNQQMPFQATPSVTTGAKLAIVPDNVHNTGDAGLASAMVAETVAQALDYLDVTITVDAINVNLGAVVEGINELTELLVLPTGGGDNDVYVAGPSALNTTGPSLVLDLDDATDVSINAQINITGSEALTADAGNIVFRNVVGDTLIESVPIGSATIVNDVITVPHAAFPELTDIYVNIDAGVVTTSLGNPNLAVTGNTAMNFRTAAATPPFALGAYQGQVASQSAAGQNTMTLSLPMAAGKNIIFFYRGNTDDVTDPATVTVDPTGENVVATHKAKNTSTVGVPRSTIELYEVEITTGGTKSVQVDQPTDNWFDGVLACWAFTGAFTVHDLDIKFEPGQDVSIDNCLVGDVGLGYIHKESIMTSPLAGVSGMTERWVGNTRAGKYAYIGDVQIVSAGTHTFSHSEGSYQRRSLIVLRDL